MNRRRWFLRFYVPDDAGFAPGWHHRALPDLPGGNVGVNGDRVTAPVNSAPRLGAISGGDVVGDQLISDRALQRRRECLNGGAGRLGAITPAACIGSNAQKWNAPPAATRTQLTAIGEL